MFKKIIAALIAGFGILGGADSAKAQFLDLSHIAQANLNFDRQFNQWAWQRSLEVARYHRMTGQPIPFNAATLNQSNRELQQAYAGYNQQWKLNSDRTSQAIGNWTNGAIRGYGPYYNPSTGATYNLPWSQIQYHINQYGQAVPGYNPYQTNLYPYHGW